MKRLSVVRFLQRLLLFALMLGLTWVVAVVVTFFTAPRSNTGATHFDTLIVLGVPSNLDGSAAPEQISRVMEGVREFKAGRAGHVIVTGGAAHNEHVEAEAMAKVAIDAGVPAEDVIVEGKARNTIQNIFYSERIMRERGWGSAEVVSTASHLPRTGLILAHYGFQWRTHAAPWPPGFPLWKELVYYAYEIEGTALLRWFGYKPSPYLPRKG